jgi:hypothetical protein
VVYRKNHSHLYKANLLLWSTLEYDSRQLMLSTMVPPQY